MNAVLFNLFIYCRLILFLLFHGFVLEDVGFVVFPESHTEVLAI